MASTVLANRTAEPNWASPSHQTVLQLPNRGIPKFMGKVPSISNLNNPNSKFPKKKHQSLPALDLDEFPTGGLTHSTASDDASSINRRPTSNNHAGDFNSAGYVSFNVSRYTRKELAELKERLLSELERVRQLRNRIESSEIYHSKKPTPSQSVKKSKNNLSGNKRPLPSTIKDVKQGYVNSADKSALLKKCGHVLSKLMKHKHGYIFNSPVDVVGLKLHDYYDIIKSPMDLGTVKAKLGKSLYPSPKEFAADVRLTFDNAMRYNPKGHDVCVLAEQFLARFEEWYKPIKENERLLDLEEELEVEEELVREVEASSWDNAGGEEGGLIHTQNVEDSVVQMPARPPSLPAAKPQKLPKPKAKDPNKRDMTLDEKHKLGMELQVLPPEKMEQVVAIIRKRNGHLRQDGDEIELDIEAVDTETLWELDRFITNYKKAVSKMRRQSMIGGATVGTSEVTKEASVAERAEVTAETKKTGEEEVDIGEEMPASVFPPVEIEKDNANGHVSSSESGSSSESDDESSSSSDSESGSSSGSDTEDAHS